MRSAPPTNTPTTNNPTTDTPTTNIPLTPLLLLVPLRRQRSREILLTPHPSFTAAHCPVTPPVKKCTEFAPLASLQRPLTSTTTAGWRMNARMHATSTGTPPASTMAALRESLPASWRGRGKRGRGERASGRERAAEGG